MGDNLLIGFFGSRRGCPERVLKKYISSLKEKYGSELTIVIGDAKGVDFQVYKIAKELGIKVRVFQTYKNWKRISYEPEPDDIATIVGKDIEPLRVRLARRTAEMVKYVHENGGVLVGCKVTGKGSQLAIRVAKEYNVPVDIIR